MREISFILFPQYNILFPQHTVLFPQERYFAPTTYYFAPKTLKYVLIRWMASLEGDNQLVFYYLTAFEIWPHKMGDLSFKGHPSYEVKFQMH
jgi:hypothetical protein